MSKKNRALYQNNSLQKQQHMTGTLFQRLQHKPQDKTTRGRGVNWTRGFFLPFNPLDIDICNFFFFFCLKSNCKKSVTYAKF